MNTALGAQPQYLMQMGHTDYSETTLEDQVVDPAIPRTTFIPEAEQTVFPQTTLFPDQAVLEATVQRLTQAEPKGID